MWHEGSGRSSCHVPGDEARPLHEFDLAVDRIRAAREAIDESGTGVVLTGRSEGFVRGRPDIDETIRRLSAYADAGADCLHAPRIEAVEHVAAIIAAVSPKPVSPADQGSVPDCFGGCSPGSAADQRRGHARAHGVVGFLEAAGEIAEAATFSRFALWPSVDGLFGDG